MSTAIRRRHAGCVMFGVLLVAVGLFLPRDWYDALPMNPAVPTPPIKGVSLLQWITVLEGIVLIALGWRRWVYVRLEPGQRLTVRGPADPGTLISARAALGLLGMITLLALTLRCLKLDADFWFDEVRATLDAREASHVKGAGPTTPNTLNTHVTTPQPTITSAAANRRRPPTNAPRPENMTATARTASRPGICWALGVKYWKRLTGVTGRARGRRRGRRRTWPGGGTSRSL